MREQRTHIEEVLESILRGAAKILGCMSANLIVFDKKTRRAHVRVGVIAEKRLELGEIEELFGNTLQSIEIPFCNFEESLVYASWIDARIYETSSLIELTGRAFPSEIIRQVSTVIGDQRFISVPVVCGRRIFGVIIFTKEDLRPYGLQRREILLRYAQRIGEIIENELRGRDSSMVLSDSEKPRSQSGQSQLLQFALGDTAPAVLVDPQFNITSCNEATEHLLGYKPDELVQQSISLLFKEAKDIHAILNHQFLFLSNGYFEDTTIVKHKNGRIFPGKIEALLLADENNQVIGFLVLIHDDSNFIGASHDEDSVNHLMRMERLATMGEIAAQLAHEIRNPLVSIGATLEMLTKDEYRKKDNWETLKVLAKEVTRMDMILKDYLSLAARRNASVSKVDMAEIVEDALRLLEGTQVTEGKKITSNVTRGLHVLADYDGLMHVFHNLLKNALEATPNGSEIRCHASALDDNVIIHIDDPGAGFSCGSNECFKPFFTTKSNGTGLGLAVCEKIIKSHAGTISLKNRREGGCRASVVLPQGTIK